MKTVSRVSRAVGLPAREFALVRFLRHCGPSCPDEVAEALELTRPTCARLIAGMANRGWITQARQGQPKGGRPPVFWDIVPQAACEAGLAVEVGRLTAAVADLAGNLVIRVERDFEPDAGAEAFADAAVSLLREALDGIASHRLLGVGVTVPGMLDRRQGKMDFCAHYRDVVWWRGFPLISKLRTATAAPIFFDHHINARILGEHWFGRNRNVGDMLYIPIEMQGVGAGMLVNGRVQRGAGGNAGEFGHMIIEKNGRACRCGSCGCLETYVSGMEAARKAQEQRESGCVSAIFEGLAEDAIPSVRRIADAAAKGDRIARNIVEETGRLLGVGIINLVNLLNPALIVIGGELAGAGDVLLDSVLAVVQRRALERQAAEARIVCADSSPDDMIRGTIAMVLHETFGSPCSSPKHKLESRPAPN